jgi:N utilization substance protein B
MQALYAFNQAKQAGKNVVLEEIKSRFDPDLNSMEIQPSENEASANKKLVQQLFQDLLPKDKWEFDAETPETIKEAVTGGIQSYHNALSKDRKHFKQLMVREVEEIYNRFLKILILPTAFARQNEIEREKNANRQVKQAETFGRYNLSENKIIQALSEDSSLEAILLKKNINWNNELDDVKQWYKSILKEDEEYLASSTKKKTTVEEDMEFLNYVFRAVVFKNEELNNFFELWDINWSEDRDIIRSLIKKSLKTYDPETDPKFTLLELSINWDEDKEYFEDLYKHTIDNADKYDKILAEKSKNWDIDRISMMDKIIIEMALAEMINFPSIPVKVSINEYIELSKNYSTPKSKQFVNGVLDVLATELQNSGIIKKSGRGLIDNR